MPNTKDIEITSGSGILEYIVCGIVQYYVVKNDNGEYLVDIMDEVDGTMKGVWTKHLDCAWNYTGATAFQDAADVGGKVYAVIKEGQ